GLRRPSRSGRGRALRDRVANSCGLRDVRERAVGCGVVRPALPPRLELRQPELVGALENATRCRVGVVGVAAELEVTLRIGGGCARAHRDAEWFETEERESASPSAGQRYVVLKPSADS